MTRLGAFLLLSALAIPAALATSAQQQPQPQAAKPSMGAPGIIRGRITSADNARPLRRATVFLWPDTTQAGRPILNVSTNAQGLFEIRDVPAASYFVSATRAGYIEIQHGQRRPRERGVAIEVRSGETRDRVDIALPKGSVISGRVVDELGVPYPDVTIFALEMRYQLGQRTYVPTGSARSDDLGQYRISGLQPGRYFLTANSTETWRNEKKETFGYPSSFFPGAQSLELAQALTVGISEERSNSDWMLSANRTAIIRGRVQRPTGDPIGGEPVGMNRLIGGGGILALGGLSTRTAPDGTFEFRDVPPATYSIRASSAGASASMTLPVTGADVDGVVLVPRTGNTLLATIVTEGGEPPPFPASGVRVNLIAPAGADVLPTVRVPGVDNDWTVRMTSIGGPFVFRMVGLREGWMLEAVRLGERDITDEPYNFVPAGREITDLQFVLTQSVGTVNGSVVNVDGKPTRDATVVLFADDASVWTVASRYVRSTRPTADGMFSMTGLPGGEYLAIAREFVADGEWESKEFLEAARQDAVRVTLPRGGTESVALKLRAP